MKTKKSMLIIGLLLFASAFCTAQVEPFTKYYNLDPEWHGDYFKQIIHTPDGGYAAAVNQNQGFTMRTILLKLDEYGEIEWKTILENSDYPNIHSYSLCIDDVGNYYLAGDVQRSYEGEFLYYTASIAKFSNEGALLWHKTYNTNPDNNGTYDGINRIRRFKFQMHFFLRHQFIKDFHRRFKV